jgi:hypothetical protein
VIIPFPVQPVAATTPRSDVPKPTCPVCGSQRSRVYRSKGAMQSDLYRRRRRCLECTGPNGERRTWPTLEGLDVPRFLRELEAEGVNPADLGLIPAAAA